MKIDPTKRGYITTSDIGKFYCAYKHPSVKSGKPLRLLALYFSHSEHNSRVETLGVTFRVEMLDVTVRVETLGVTVRVFTPGVTVRVEMLGVTVWHN